MGKKRKQSLYVKQNVVYQAFLAGLVIMLSVVFVIVILSVDLPVSSVWKNNVLLRMIQQTQQFIRQGR